MRQIKVPWLSGSGVGRVVSQDPRLSPPKQSLLLSSSAAQNAREAVGGEVVGAHRWMLRGC